MMSQRSRILLAVMAALLLVPTPSPGAAADAHRARLATYDSAQGETLFALSVSRADETVMRTDVVVLVDTSASQIGLFREDSLRFVRHFTSQLSADDRLIIAAVDLEPVRLTSRWVSPGSSEVTQALQQLKLRTPLGATDLVSGLQAALDWLQTDQRKATRCIMLVGDAQSRANLFDESELRDLARRCRLEQVSISSFVIGPQRDVKFAAILANHSGGVTVVDREGEAAVESSAALLAKATHVPVWYPVHTHWSKNVAEAYPVALPPLRADRDSIVVGRLASRTPIRLAAQLESPLGQRSFKLTAQPQPSSSEFAFLSLFLEIVRQDNGLRMPTAGSDGLREVARLLSEPELESENNNQAVDREADDPPSHSRLESRLATSNVWFITTQEPAGGRDGGQQEDKNAGGNQSEQPAGQAGDDVPPGKLIREVRQQQQVLAAKMEAEVQVRLQQARKLMADAPDRVQETLKILLDQVRTAPELQPEMRARLVDQIEVALKQAARRQLSLDEERRVLAENRARAEESRRLLELLQRNRDDAKQLMARFHSLMQEAGDDSEKYLIADEEIAKPIRDELVPNESIGTSAVWRARLMRQIVGHESFREQRHRDFADTLYLVDRAADPFPDDPPIRYPDAETWIRLSEARRKYASFELLGETEAAKKIREALDKTVDNFQFVEQTLEDVINFIRTEYQIQVQFDRQALVDADVEIDQPTVSVEVSGVTLRDALRLVLDPQELTFMIKNNVLMITTKEVASQSENLITRVYQVGDLVVPIIPLGGGFGGGGFGGGGGLFVVRDELRLTEEKAHSSDDVQSDDEGVLRIEDDRDVKARPTVEVDAPPIHLKNQTWEEFFAAREELAGPQRHYLARQVRATAMDLMSDKKYDETIKLLMAALRHSHLQPWMYEGIGLAMKGAGRSPREIERAMMSIIDLAGDPQRMEEVAHYFARSGHDRRAFQLYQNLATMRPYDPQPYAYALAVARRLEDREALTWACLGVLRQAWPAKFRQVEVQADRSARALIASLKAEGKRVEAVELARRFDEARRRDCKVTVTWTGDADVDLLVLEPAGTICSLFNPMTSSGGVLVGDAFSGNPDASRKEFKEEYVCGEAFPGEYRVRIRKIWGHVAADTVTVEIETRNGKKIRKQIPISDKDALVIFDVEDGRRKVTLNEEMIAAARQWQKAQQQLASRDQLRQQLKQAESQSLADGSLDDSKRQQRQMAGARRRPLRRGVGFRINPTVLPEGTIMSATGVVSGDRRYVRVTALPFFSAIGDVSVFDVSGRSSPTQPLDNNNQGGGGGN